MKLHADWPEYTEKWDGSPTSEIVAAFDSYPTFATAEPVSVKADPFTFADLESVENYYISSHGATWTPADTYIGSELDMVVVGTLRDGRWFSLVAWNDYTGWGCQDGCDIRTGASREAVIEYGLDNTERERLGVSL